MIEEIAVAAAVVVLAVIGATPAVIEVMRERRQKRSGPPPIPKFNGSGPCAKCYRGVFNTDAPYCRTCGRRTVAPTPVDEKIVRIPADLIPRGGYWESSDRHKQWQSPRDDF